MMRSKININQAVMEIYKVVCTQLQVGDRPYRGDISIYRKPTRETKELCSPTSLTQMLHVWNTYLHLDHYWGKCNYIDIPYMEHLGKDLGHHLSIELLLCHPRCPAGIVSFCSMIFPAINLHELLRVLWIEDFP